MPVEKFKGPPAKNGGQKRAKDLKLTHLPNSFTDYSLDWILPNFALVDLAVVCIT